MIRILSRDLPEKPIERALCIFFGVGLRTSRKILASLSIDPIRKPSSLDAEETRLITSRLSELKLEGILRNQIRLNVLNKVKKGIYKGRRHNLKLPVRGQRSSTNASTNRMLPKRF